VPPREGRPGEDLRGVGVAVRLVALAPARREVAAHEAEARVVQPEPDGHGALVELLQKYFELLQKYLRTGRTRSRNISTKQVLNYCILKMVKLIYSMVK